MKVVRYKHVGQASRENEADVAVEPLREVSSGNSKHLTSTPQIGFFFRQTLVLQLKRRQLLKERFQLVK